MPHLQSLSVEVAKSAMVSPGDALAYMAPGGLDQDADVLRGYILGAPSLAVNFSTLVVTTALMIRRLGETRGRPCRRPLQSEAHLLKCAGRILLTLPRRTDQHPYHCRIRSVRHRVSRRALAVWRTGGSLPVGQVFLEGGFGRLVTIGSNSPDAADLLGMTCWWVQIRLIFNHRNGILFGANWMISNYQHIFLGG